MRETQVSDVDHLSDQELADCAVIAEILLDKVQPGDLTEKLRDRRKVFLDALVTRGAIPSYSFV